MYCRKQMGGCTQQYFRILFPMSGLLGVSQGRELLTGLLLCSCLSSIQKQWAFPPRGMSANEYWGYLGCLWTRQSHCVQGATVVLKSKAASTCSHSSKWGTSQRHGTMCCSGLQRGETGWPGKKFPHCLQCVHWGCPVCWGTVGCLWGDASLCPAALSQSGRRTGSLCTLSRCKYLFIIFYYYFFGKDSFLPCPSLLTRCLWHLTGPAYGDMEEGRKQQREREGKSSFWKHENFWNINLVDNSLPAEFH